MAEPCPHCGEPISAELFYGPKGGRPSKLTPELQETICKHVMNGATLEVAAQAEWVTPRALSQWRGKGQSGSEPHEDFFLAIERARACFETNTLGRLATLDEGIEAFDREGRPFVVNKIDPKIAAALTKSLTWLLERLRRERYGTLVTVKVEEAKTYFLDTLLAVVKDNAELPAEALFEAFLDRLAGGDGGSGDVDAAPAIH